MGFSNTADSLLAVKKAVFEEERFSIGELAEWLAEDWIDAEDKRQYMVNKVPKYGNDIAEADESAARVMDHYWCHTEKSIPTTAAAPSGRASFRWVSTLPWAPLPEPLRTAATPVNPWATASRPATAEPSTAPRPS